MSSPDDTVAFDPAAKNVEAVFAGPVPADQTKAATADFSGASTADQGTLRFDQGGPSEAIDTPENPSASVTIVDPVLAADDASTATVNLSVAPTSDQATAHLDDDGRDITPTAAESRSPGHVDRIGRYTVQKRLAEGGFGTVYLARDEQLQRLVAIKVPRQSQFVDEKAVDAFLAEARVAAGLSHPGIVTIFDVGREVDRSGKAGTCFVVMEYLPGRSLEDLLACDQLPYNRLAELLAEVSDGVHYAHKHQLVHRDLKPANILFDAEGRPRVADFGLAVHTDAQRLLQGQISGTPSYMAPEQVRGESHRFDGRTDVWALGVILYEALCRQRPFAAPAMLQLFRQIQNDDPKPPRQVDAAVPAALERIALKCLSRRMSDRFATAAELADELRGAAADFQERAAVTDQIDAAAARVEIVPRGLRSFNSRDAEFFLRLVPGPVDRAGIPESVGVWKDRVEQLDSDRTFAVGLLYGPTGCGKSSLVRAGLMPHLSGHVSAIYIEAKPDQTEALLLRSLYKLCPALPDKLSLPELMARLRDGQALPTGQKICIFLDQFEQWLHAHRPESELELVQALRHCDGGHVQCVIMVRDDFWLAVSRFMRELEVPLVEGQNAGLVDLFDLPHAAKVLSEFGWAFNRIDSAPSAQQQAFLQEAVEGLAQDGKVISVRLALFAEMMRSRPWTLESLRAVGGSRGVGATFLEETFVGAAARPECRLHEQAARSVLAALLPEAGTDIKGRMRARDELLAVSGYAERPDDFQGLMRLLDSDLRLVTPTDPDSAASDQSASIKRSLALKSAVAADREFIEHAPAPAGAAYFQLAHDYLVPSLREWLTERQRQTRRGRAALRLAEMSRWWNDRPIPRNLPGGLEWLNLLILTRSRAWTLEQQKFMRAAARHHLARGALALAAIFALLAAGLMYKSRNDERLQSDRAEGLVMQLIRADSGQVPRIVEDIQDFMHWAAPRLRKLVEGGAFESTDKLHASLALLPADERQTDYLSARLLQTTIEEFPMVRDALRPFASRFIPQLRETLHDVEAPLEARFRAGMALVDYAPTSPDWTPADWELLARQLTLANPDYQRSLRKYLRRADAQLIEPLRSICLDATLRETQRDAACIAITDFAADQVDVLADLIARVTPPQYAIVEPVLVHAQKSGQAVREALLAIVLQKLPEGHVLASDRLESGRRRGRAAIAAVHFGARAEVLDIFRDANDLEAQSQFVHGLRDRGLQALELLECFDRLGDEHENADPVRYGLLLALGEFSLDAVPAERRNLLVKHLAAWYKSSSDAAVHSASGWLLQAWGRNGDLPALDAAELANDKTINREWIVQRAGDDAFTMMVRPPVKHIMIGSFPDEPDRVAGEGPVPVDLPYTWAIADREVTRGQFERFQKATNRALLPIDAWSPTAEHPMVAMTWFEAVLYCRWLTLEAGMSESDQCYPDPDSPDIEKATLEDGTIFPKNWTVDTRRFGFRLPLEVEWEIACRAGAMTGYSFGYDKALLRHYGWYLDNEGKKSHVGGTLRPNRNGLFDMHGNLIEWCNDWFADYPTPENPDPLKGQAVDRRVYRGGAFDLGERRLRSAWRDGGRPAGRNADCGMRLVRTLGIQPSQPDQSAQ
jgi:serine/threonine protein kinase/formylglycine-generating enzyme required for sulfatase activity